VSATETCFEFNNGLVGGGVQFKLVRKRNKKKTIRANASVYGSTSYLVRHGINRF
jgi:hypothetical protein